MKKRKYFLVGYTLCVTLFYAVAYLFIQPAPLRRQNKTETAAEITVSTPIFNHSQVYPPQTGAESYAVIDGKSGGIICEKNSSARLPMASTTKIITAIIIIEEMPQDMLLSVPKDATLAEGSSIYLKENEKLSVKDLLYGLLLESGNDAAITLAIGHSGSVEKFTQRMNEFVAELGLKNTMLANPHGLTAENHYTTAMDLSQITMYAMNNDTFRRIVSTKKYISQSNDGKFTRYFFNHNKLLTRYDGAIGVKTGYTKAAGRCLVSAATREDEMYICVTLNDKNDWSDHDSLLSHAFDSYKSIEIATPDSFGVYINGRRYICSTPVYMTTAENNDVTMSYTLNIDKNQAYVDYYAENAKLGRFFLTAD